jgi:hypothetical protein
VANSERARRLQALRAQKVRDVVFSGFLAVTPDIGLFIRLRPPPP